MPPRELSQLIPAPPWAKARMQKPLCEGKFLVQMPRAAQGMVMDETDTCIIRLIEDTTFLSWTLKTSAKKFRLLLVRL